MAKRKITTLILAVLSFITIAFSVVTFTANAAPQWSNTYLQEYYAQGDSLTIVERKITLDDGTVLTPSIAVTLPDGVVTSERQLTLTQAGIYKVKYTAINAGKTYLDEVEFTVKYTILKKTSNESSVVYGSHSVAPEVNGLVVRLQEGEKLQFNQIIDITKVTSSDILVECFVSPDLVGKKDFNKLYFQFTDIEDPNNYLRIRGAGEGPSTYTLAGGNGQPMSGYESGRNYLHIENNYGSPSWHSFDGTYNGVTTDCGKKKYSVSYDYASKSVYGGGTFAIDLDNSKYFTSLWEGFKSGKVRLSVWADAYSGKSANFVITKIFGMDISSYTFDETDAPVITVNSEYSLEDMPKAKVGSGYPIPTATAKDDYSGACGVTTTVWYNYKAGANPVKYQIKNGAFTPTKAGDYAIVYESSDKLGNIAKQVVSVKAETDLSAPVVTLTDSFSQNVYLGDWVEFPSFEVTGGSGNSTVKTVVEFGGVETVVSGGFRPEKEGNYSVSIIATDYIGQQSEYSYTVKAVRGSVPIFVEEPILPKYFVSGSEYVLPELYAYDYTTGSLVKKLASIKVKDKNGERNLAKGEKYIPVVSSNMETVEIIYECEGATFTKKIPTVIAWVEESGRPRLRIENYFDLTGATITKNSENSVITATASNAKWTFANAQLAEGFSFVLLAQTGASYFDGLKITYTDSQNDNVSVSFTIMKNGNSSIAYVGSKSSVINVGFESNSSNKFEIGYKNGKILISGVSFAVATTDNGETFNGFDSNKLYLTVEMLNAVSGAKYAIEQINSHMINTTSIDRIGPRITLDENRGGSHLINTTLNIPSAFSADAVDPNVIFTVTVKDPNGNIAKDVNGKELKDVDPTVVYSVKFDIYGQYIVTYSSKDVFNASANVTTYTYAITIEDNVNPEIVLTNGFQSSVKVGEIIVIPTISVNDNVSAEEKIALTRTVITPSGVYMLISEEFGGVKATEVGVYKFQIFAMDESGNITIRYYEVVATEV